MQKQSAAAGCLCNLALGDSKAGFTITKAAGPYLTAALDSLSSELAVSIKCYKAINNLDTTFLDGDNKHSARSTQVFF